MSSSVNPHSNRLYRTQFEEAERLFHDGKLKECIEAAKLNLTDRTLPPYYFIRNCILIVGALEDWDEAEIWRLTAEQEYSTTLIRSRQNQDAKALEILQGFREELDQLIQFKYEDLYGDSEMEDNYVEDDERMEDEENWSEDQEAVAAVESEDVVVVETLDLPLRPKASETPP